MSSEAPDEIEGIAHPRATYGLIGHGGAEKALHDGYMAGRLHHAWLIAGPRGIGKSTLAYRFARFLLAGGRTSAEAGASLLQVDPAAGVSRRIEQQGHGDLHVLSRRWQSDKKAFASEIRVDDVRRVGPFLGSTAAEEGWRVVIVDRADDLNANAANAMLKVLEEPPARAVFLLVTERPHRLPATLRSRCRQVGLRPLADSDVVAVLSSFPALQSLDAAALHALAIRSGGSVRRALEIFEGHEETIQARLSALLASLPSPDRKAALELADAVSARGGEGLSTFVSGVLDHAHARAVAHVDGPPDRARLARWSEVWENTASAARTVDTYNLDRRPFVLSTLAMLAAAAR